jgi:anti-sigma factor RsiW
MRLELTDAMLSAYVDQELPPALMSQIEAAARRSSEIRIRLDAIRRVNAAVRATATMRTPNRE